MIVLDEIRKLLDSKNIEYKCWTHQECSTSEEGAAIRGTEVMSGAKALIFRTEGTFAMLVIAGDKKVDLKMLKFVLKATSLSLATPEEAFAVTHCAIGSIPPFGSLFGIPVYVDKSLYRNERINFNAGRHDTSIQMGIEDWERVASPKLISVAQ